MTSIRISERSKEKTLHIEAPGCIINVHIGLFTSDGQAVTAITIQCDQYAGEPIWTLPDYGNAATLNVRAVREDWRDNAVTKVPD